MDGTDRRFENPLSGSVLVRYLDELGWGLGIATDRESEDSLQSMDAAQTAYEMFLGLIRSGKSPEQAQSEMLNVNMKSDLVSGAVKRFQDVVRDIITLRLPPGLVEPGVVPWYTGPREGDECWPPLHQHILNEDGFPATAVDSLDRASTKVVAHLPPPYQSTFNGRGLVLGYVQSGKTSNYTGVIAKAADAGYRLFIVLSGIHNNLRRQTQARLDKQLVELNPGLWHELTTEVADFGRPGNAESLLTLSNRKLLAVVKKNKSRLTNLLNWIESASEVARAKCPILIIDDESDQASVNAGDADNRTRINELLIRLLSLRRVAYVGYTATPYANLFIDPSIPQDLYPRDFIVDLPPPSDYFGADRIFGREQLAHDDEDPDADGLDMIRLVPDEEAELLRPPRNKSERANFAPPLTENLERAIRYFLLATAARWARGHTSAHSSMLIHTTVFTDVHDRLRDPVVSEVAGLGARLQLGDGRLNAELEELWSAETEAVAAEGLGEKSLSFEDLIPHIARVVDSVSVIVDNYRSSERLDYGSGPKTVIVIGGNTLSRGLTLEGLVVSFFLRTASAYDTLLQMGRWFGYRRGYSDLPRIWLTAELAEFFHFLATVEQEIRYDVARYEQEGKTPRQLATRVRTHPKLAITSALKMQAAVPAKVSYSARRVQTILFNHRRKDWLRENLKACKKLLESSMEIVGRPEDIGRGRFLLGGVPVRQILDFLNAYEFHAESVDLRADLMTKYIRAQNRHEELLEWNVAIMGRADKARGVIDLGLPDEIGLINRARISIQNLPHANIKSLMSRIDRVVDLNLSMDELRHKDDRALQDLRPKGKGLLLMYPIDKNSEPINVRGRRGLSRIRLEALEHVMGVGLVFPRSQFHETLVDYMSVDLSSVDREEDEGDPEDFDTEESLEEVDNEAQNGTV